MLQEAMAKSEFPYAILLMPIAVSLVSTLEKSARVSLMNDEPDSS